VQNFFPVQGPFSIRRSPERAHVDAEFQKQRVLNPSISLPISSP
jgi:hypothetical protein